MLFMREASFGFYDSHILFKNAIFFQSITFTQLLCLRGLFNDNAKTKKIGSKNYVPLNSAALFTMSFSSLDVECASYNFKSVLFTHEHKLRWEANRQKKVWCKRLIFRDKNSMCASYLKFIVLKIHIYKWIFDSMNTNREILEAKCLFLDAE